MVGAEAGGPNDRTGIELRAVVEGHRPTFHRDGTPVQLTPIEYGVFSHLRKREGKTVSRPELLREVWETEFTGGSNVVDAAVRSLRRKLR